MGGAGDRGGRDPWSGTFLNLGIFVFVERIVTGAEVTETKVLEGERSCRPEDVGGPPGYMEYLEALQDPSHPDHQQMVEWRGPSFDPERFDPAGINRRLSQLSRKRHRPSCLYLTITSSWRI
jgi:hypothetical protein